MCEYIDEHYVPSEPLLDQLVDQRWLSFLAMDMSYHLMTGSHHQQNDVMDKTHPLSQHNDCSVLLLLLSLCQIYIPSTMRLCNSRTPKECLVCYQTSQRNWVIIDTSPTYLELMKYSCYYIIHLGCFMGFTMHYYIISGTNLLTQSPVPVPVFSLVSVFRRKGISNGVETE